MQAQGVGPGRLAERLSAMASGETLRFPLAALPLSELLLTLQSERFTGGIALRAGGHTPAPHFSSTSGGRASLVSGTDLLFVREGGLVGLETVGRAGVRGLAEVLLALRLLDRAEVEAFAGGASHGLELGRQLSERGLISGRDLDRAVAEHGRRRLFARASDDRSMVDIRAGMDALAHFHPVYIDLRPAVAFGLVVHGRPVDKRAQMMRATQRYTRLVAPYDTHRNAYGLPPPVLEALEALGRGVMFGDPPRFRSLSWSDTAGVLLLLDRIGLLEVHDAPIPSDTPHQVSESF